MKSLSRLVLPFIGNTISLVRNPTKFWDLQSAMARSSDMGFSVNYIIGRFIVFIRSTNLSHKVFANVKPDAFHLVGHPFGKKLFGEHNLIYMMGQEHKDLRRRIAPNFTPKALSTYTQLQQDIILKHLKYWMESPESIILKHSFNNKSWIESPESYTKPFPLRLLCRDMNLETSQNVFVGPYLSGDSRKRFEVDCNFFNVGLMKLPIDLSGTALRNARLAVSRLIETLSVCAEDSKTKMKTGEDPTCLVDFWMQDTLREIVAAEEAGEQQPPPHSNTTEIGGHLFNFLFASQDASTSSLLWAVTLLDSHPKVLERVRKRPSISNEDSNGTIDNEELKRCLQKLQFQCTDQEIGDLFVSCDVDDSNGIQFNEFIVLLCLIHLLAGPSSSSQSTSTVGSPELKATFDTIIEAFLFLDKNGDGKLNKKDMIKAMNEDDPMEKSPTRITKTRFKEMDWNKDGKVSFREFLFSLIDWVGFDSTDEVPVTPS
ncbi:unnamed protein product [Lactuca virosa]|uniref:EF-hand domain-containing protein n=1 Tax=Lactuca virosa TaxID=75947 RepID=A0AAU9PRF1_9ASTR|nr:unnamed protein product [Lactuca virosa]